MPGLEVRSLVSPPAINLEPQHKPEILGKPKEKCAIVGVMSFDGRNVSRDVAVSLLRMDNRGQEGSGIAALRPDGGFTIFKADGFPKDIWQTIDPTDPDKKRKILNEKLLEEKDLTTDAQIGQNRYVTSDGDADIPPEEAHQPFVKSYEGRTLALSHNGNIPQEYVDMMKAQLPPDFIPVAGTDTEILTMRIASSPGKTWEEKITNGLHGIVGAYSLTILTDEGEMFGIRDPWGIRPLTFAHTEDGVAIASETNGLLGMKVVSKAEIEPGEMYHANKYTRVVESRRLFPQRAGKPCLIESVYFSDRRSEIGGRSVEEMRYNMGQALAAEKIVGLEYAIVGVAGSATEIADGYADALGRPHENNLLEVEKGSVGARSFIMDDEDEREAFLKQKFEVSDEVFGRYILLIDDSVIRGGTTKVLIDQFMKKGALGVKVLSASPRFLDTCDMGVNIADRRELVALYVNDEGDLEIRTDGEIAEEIGAEEIYYLSLEGLANAAGGTPDNFCTHCLTSIHPMHDLPAEELARAVTPIKDVFVAA